jgi:hypothetical protein
MKSFPKGIVWAGALILSIAAYSAVPALAQQKTIKACEDEWKAHKADNQAKGVTEKSYVEKCRAASAEKPKATPTSAPVQKPAPTQTKTEPPKTAPKQTAATGKPAGANQFAAEGQAKSHCPTGLVVWANLNTKVYHFAGNGDYGKTKKGAYMCEKDATGQGMRAAKNEKHL